MTKKIETTIEIKATPEQVWKVLTDFEKYSEWNSFIKSIEGKKAQGEQWVIHIEPPNRKMMKFTPKVLKFEPNKELRWLGSAAIKGIFDGEHYFKITNLNNGFIRFDHGEIFKGLLVGFMPKLMKDTQVGFEQMNEALKAYCEK